MTLGQGGSPLFKQSYALLPPRLPSLNIIEPESLQHRRDSVAKIPPSPTPSSLCCLLKRFPKHLDLVPRLAHARTLSSTAVPIHSLHKNPHHSFPNCTQLPTILPFSGFLVITELRFSRASCDLPQSASATNHFANQTDKLLGCFKKRIVSS